MAKLNEVEKRFQTRLVTDLEPYVGKGYWVHFGQTPKLGIKPSLISGDYSHNDPVGVYFYPLDWLLSSPRFIDGAQFATEYPYWTVVKIIENPNGVVFSQLTSEKLEQLAKRLNWTNWEKEKTHSGFPATPPEQFWWYIRTDKHRGNSLLKGIPYVIDDGLGVIYPREPYQMAVLDPRCITVIAKGLQYSHGEKWKHAQNKEPLGTARYTVIEIMKQLRGRYGGDITWKDKIPTLTISIPEKSTSFVIKYRTSYSPSIALEAKWGRAVRHLSMDVIKIERSSMEVVMDYYTSVMDHIIMLGAKGKDLFFTPVISEKQAKQFMATIVDLKGMEVTTEISNDSAFMSVVAKKTFTEEKNKLEVGIVASIRKASKEEPVSWMVYVKVNGFHIVDARVEDPDKLGQAIKDSLIERTTHYKKSEDGNSYSRRKFYYDGDFIAFLGWVSYNSNIIVLKDNEEYIKAYEADKNKSYLFSEIKRVF